MISTEVALQHRFRRDHRPGGGSQELDGERAMAASGVLARCMVLDPSSDTTMYLRRL
jgi:hypothetical protein